jgi:hypothetical protein
MTKQYRSWFAPDVAGVIMEDYLQEASNSGLEPERVIIDCLTKVV